MLCCFVSDLHYVKYHVYGDIFIDEEMTGSLQEGQETSNFT